MTSYWCDKCGKHFTAGPNNFVRYCSDCLEGKKPLRIAPDPKHKEKYDVGAITEEE